MSNNPVALALAAAERHADNPAVVALAEKLKIAQQLLPPINNSPAHPFVNPLAAYQRGALGEDGYGLMFSLDASLFGETLKHMSALRNVAVITECLIAVLGTLGEDIAY